MTLTEQLKRWEEDKASGPETKKLAARLKDVKTDEDAGLLNRLLDDIAKAFGGED